MGLMHTFFVLLIAASIAPESAKVEYRQPQLAADANMVAVTFGSGNAVYFASSHDQGHTLSTPVKVAEAAKQLSLGRHRGPRVAITRSGIVISAIADGDLKAWRSTDGGKTWSTGVTINDKPSAAREGLHAMVAGPDGRLFAAWLDDRADEFGGGKKLDGAWSSDGGVTWSKNTLIYRSPSGTICQCCHPSLVIDARGVIHAMWRNALEGNRDFYLAQSTDGGVTFSSVEKLGRDSWKLDACPMDGGGLVVDGQGKLVSVWRRQSSIYLDEPGAAERMIGPGKDAAIAIGKAGVYVAWSGKSGIVALTPGKTEPVEVSAQGGYPVLAALPDGSVLAAWEDQGRIQTKALPLH